jgi:hypothetical protein
MILSRMQTLSECPDGMTVAVSRRGETWEALTMSPIYVAYTDCVEYALAATGSSRIKILRREPGEL